jgi:hypothetical protein
VPTFQFFGVDKKNVEKVWGLLKNCWGRYESVEKPFKIFVFVEKGFGNVWGLLRELLKTRWVC